MGAPRARSGPEMVKGGTRQGGSAAAVLDFAVAQILRDDTALGALPAVLGRLADTFGLRAALAFQPSAVQPPPVLAPTVLAVHPRGAVDPGLLARIGAPTLSQREGTAASPVQLRQAPDGPEASVLLAYSVPVGGRCLCALALIGGAASWDEEVRATAHAVAALVATQIRHANDLAKLAERQTQIERSHAALADQTERLNCLIASAIPAVLITNERCTVTNISRSFGVMFGVDEPDRLVGTSARSVMRRIERVFADPAHFTRRAAAVVRARQPMTGEQIQSADGRTIECDYWPVLVDGRYRGDIWLAWDMSDRKELEQQRVAMLEAELAARRLAEQAQSQLTEQNERLRKIDEARNQFLAIVSHELRTPLTSIVSFSELIRGEAEGLTLDGVRFLDIIERNANRMHRLVGDLLMLDRLEAGALPLDLAPVSIADLAAEAVRSASAPAAKQGITVDVATGNGPAVTGDHRRLMQVLDNLIANAVKFSHRNQRVHVEAAYDGSQWRIEVTDSGIGIPGEEVGELFSRFVRASNARTAGLPGTGLGLSIVKVLVEMHGGHVEVDSTLGHGSTFSVFLPAPHVKAPA
jgi:signal transduction histidine kinase